MLFVILLLLMVLFSVDDTTYWWYYFLFLWYYFIADDSTFCYTYNQGSNLWLQLELASQLEYDLWYWTWSESGLLILILKKFNLLSLNSLITLVLFMCKPIGLLLKMLELSCSSKLDKSSYIVSLQKLLLGLFVLWNFFLLRLLFISVNLPYKLVWNNVAVSGIMLPATT